MDFVPLIDRVGEPATAALIGLGLGLAFGVFALISDFCTRSAVLDVMRPERGFGSLAIWLLAFAIAIGGTQALLASDLLSVSETRFFSTPQSLSGAVIGGLAFGIGMVLTRGCTSRLLVLGASGNLRALVTLTIIAFVAWLTYQGALVPLRNSVGSLASTAQIGGNSAGSAIYGLVLATLLAVASLALLRRNRVRAPHLIGAAGIGALIPAGWYLTHSLSQQVFEPIQAESLSFMRPLASSINFGVGGGASDLLNMDVGLIGGTLVGAFLAALATRRLRIATFSEPGTPPFLRYVIGGVLMGFGGILAVGCTIGAGFTGGAVLAVSSLVGLASMIIGAAVTDRLVDQKRATALTFLAPAE